MQSKSHNYLLYSCGFVILCVVLSLFCVDLLLNRVPPREARPVDFDKLRRLHSAVLFYYKEYSEIPPEGNLKQLLLERNIVVDEEIFYSAPSGIEIRYFTSGNRFVFVAPGHNGRYDSPEGYEFLKASKETGDDYVRFDHVLEKLEKEK